MQKIRKRVIEEFGHRLRVRVCGICIENEKILMVNHQSLTKENDFWGPPGGGMDFGSSAEENLKREFLEETGLRINVEDFLFVHEYLSPPLHAIELIFRVRRRSGTLRTGFDPEMGRKEQIIKHVQFMDIEEINALDRNSLHQMFTHLKSIKDIKTLRGYHLWKTS
ncbi:MAG: NUDIX hydrolase [Cytophagales bacterium]|nr:NUDIX hydrolase [Cytophagales bacterium]